MTARWADIIGYWRIRLLFEIWKIDRYSNPFSFPPKRFAPRYTYLKNLIIASLNEHISGDRRSAINAFRNSKTSPATLTLILNVRPHLLLYAFRRWSTLIRWKTCTLIYENEGFRKRLPWWRLSKTDAFRIIVDVRKRRKRRFSKTSTSWTG